MVKAYSLTNLTVKARNIKSIATLKSEFVRFSVHNSVIWVMHFFIFINIVKGMVILMKKTILSVLLCFTLIICIIPQSTYAQLSRDTSFEEELATDLKVLGLFKGVSDTNFDLNREPTRVEALVMLIRVLGKEAEALNSNCSHPFTDVPTWADKYVGYAYENGLTKGTSATTFGTENANSAMYITFILRALGYSDVAGEDFTWDNPYMLAKKIGILPTFVDTSNFLRADAVTVSYAALRAKLKNSEIPLEMFLEESGVFDGSSFIKYYDMHAIGRKESELASDFKELSPKEIFNACSPSVFYIETWDESLGTYNLVGSGFFITSDGVAVTNYHVLENTDSANIWLPNGTGYAVLGVLYFDKELDFAVIKTIATNVPFLNIGNSLDVYSGDEIYTIGNPQGLTNTISNGIVSNPCREDFNGMIQITAPISPGSSGGALLNSRGEVIGITTATLTSGQNLNFAVPINEVVNKNDIPTMESKYNMFTMEEFATYNGYNVKIEPPKNIRVVRQQNGSAHIQWDEVEGAEYYHFYYKEAGEDTYWYDEDDNGEKLKFKYRDDYTVSYNGLENGKIYNVIVTSVKNGVESQESNVFSFEFNTDSNIDILRNTIMSNGTFANGYLYKIGTQKIYEQGIEHYTALVYDSKSDVIYIETVANFSDGNTVANLVYLDGASERINEKNRVTYLFMETNGRKTVGSTEVNPTTFKESSNIVFNYYNSPSGNIVKSEDQVLSTQFTKIGLREANQVFDIYKMPLDMADFGFVYFKK